MELYKNQKLKYTREEAVLKKIRPQGSSSITFLPELLGTIGTLKEDN